MSPLANLTSLQSLDLSGCGGLSGSLSPLAGLTSLQSLDLSMCGQLCGDLSPLAGLASLQKLYLSGCIGIPRFAQLKSLLPTLQELRLFGRKLDDLPPEAYGESQTENVLDKVRAHYEDLKSGHRIDAEVKTTNIGKGPFGVGCRLQLSSSNHNYEVVMDGSGSMILGRVEKDGKRVKLGQGGTGTEVAWAMLLKTIEREEKR